MVAWTINHATDILRLVLIVTPVTGMRRVKTDSTGFGTLDQGSFVMHRESIVGWAMQQTVVDAACLLTAGT